MPKTDRTVPADTEEVVVRLKPALGMKPVLYLTLLYGVVVALLVFFFLFYPGLGNRGSYFAVTTFPDQATVKVDGVYAGSTPAVIFIRKGTRTVDISKPFYAPVTFSQQVRGRVFATLFVRDKKRIDRSLSLQDADGLLRWAYADFQKNPEIARIISDAAWAVRGSSPTEALYGFLLRSLSYVTDESQLRELVLAAARVSSGGAFLSPSSLVSLLQETARLTKSYDNLPAWLLLTVSKANAAALSKAAWAQSFSASYVQAMSRYVSSPGASAGQGGSVTVAGIPFRAIPAGVLAMGRDDNAAALGTSVERDLLHPVSIASFYLGTTEVTNRSFLAFVAENPDWAPAARAALAAKGLVTDTYLSGWTGAVPAATSMDQPVTDVSWHAAVAFAGWLTRKVQAVLPGYLARLPLESEWEWAARGGLRGKPFPGGATPGNSVSALPGITGPSDIGASDPNGYGLRDMIGNVWEWCADPFNRTSYLLSSFDPQTNATLELALPDGPDRSVRGGGWGNQAGSAKVWTRGSQPADWCTPWLGFRVALARR